MGRSALRRRPERSRPERSRAERSRAERSRPGRRRLTATLLVAVVVGVALPTASAPAWAAPGGEAVVALAAAAVAGAGDAASAEVAARTEAAGVAVGGTAARWTAPPSPPVVVATPAPASGPRPVVSHGWVSGAAGQEAEDGSFATWRGRPLGVVGVWADTSVEAQTNLDAVDNYAGYSGQMDVAVGALVSGETWEQAASGAFVDRWTAAMRKLKAARAGKGTTYVRIAHEMNGDWMPWGMNSSSLAAYKQGYRLYAGIVRKEFPAARLTWSPNGGNHNDLTVDQMYPGDDVVDVVGPDIYDGFPDVTSMAVWNGNLYSATGASPKGIGAWQRWAARRGKPLAMPEWGLPYGDHPFFVQGMNEFLHRYAAVPGGNNAGRFVYDVYFNVEDKFKIYPGPNVAAGEKYKSLTWGS